MTILVVHCTKRISFYATHVELKCVVKKKTRKTFLRKLVFSFIHIDDKMLGKTPFSNVCCKIASIWRMSRYKEDQYMHG